MAKKPRTGHKGFLPYLVQPDDEVRLDAEHLTRCEQCGRLRIESPNDLYEIEERYTPWPDEYEDSEAGKVRTYRVYLCSVCLPTVRSWPNVYRCRRVGDRGVAVDDE